MARVMCRLLLLVRLVHLALRERKTNKQTKKMASPDKDGMLDTLTLLEMDLVKFVPSVWNLKLSMATGGNLSPLNAPNNITVYELWGDEDSN